MKIGFLMATLLAMLLACASLYAAKAGARGKHDSGYAIHGTLVSEKKPSRGLRRV